jgi:DNA-binding NtrC family response regulator
MKKLVLLIDDEEIIRITSGEIMTELGFDVITASNGNEGLETFKKRSNDISLVILDLTLPDRPGLDIFHEILNIDPDVKVMLTSGFTQDLLDRDNVVFIQKPYTISDLSKKLNELTA